MKKKFLLLVVFGSLASWMNAHDDLIYRTQSGWSDDIGNQSHITQTVDAAFKMCIRDRINALNEAQESGHFDAEKYVGNYPVKKDVYKRQGLYR